MARLGCFVAGSNVTFSPLLLFPGFSVRAEGGGVVATRHLGIAGGVRGCPANSWPTTVVWLCVGAAKASVLLPVFTAVVRGAVCSGTEGPAVLTALTAPLVVHSEGEQKYLL